MESTDSDNKTFNFIGYFKDEMSTFLCEPCDKGYNTTNEGTASAEDCLCKYLCFLEKIHVRFH